MKTKMVIIHSCLIIVASCMWGLLESTAGFGFMLLFIIMFFDFPVMILFHKIIWPHLAGNDLWPHLNGDLFLGILTTSFWFLLVGGFYWFCIGLIIERIRKRKGRAIEN